MKDNAMDLQSYYGLGAALCYLHDAQDAGDALLQRRRGWAARGRRAHRRLRHGSHGRCRGGRRRERNKGRAAAAASSSTSSPIARSISSSTHALAGSVATTCSACSSSAMQSAMSTANTPLDVHGGASGTHASRRRLDATKRTKHIAPQPRAGG